MPAKGLAGGVELSFGLFGDDEVRVVQENIPADNSPDPRDHAFVVDQIEKRGIRSNEIGAAT